MPLVFEFINHSFVLLGEGITPAHLGSDERFLQKLEATGGLNHKGGMDNALERSGGHITEDEPLVDRLKVHVRARRDFAPCREKHHLGKCFVPRLAGSDGNVENLIKCGCKMLHEPNHIRWSELRTEWDHGSTDEAGRRFISCPIDRMLAVLLSIGSVLGNGFSMAAKKR